MITVHHERGVRWYTDGALRVPAVSEILAATRGRVWGLEVWRRQLGDRTADEVAAMAAARGTTLHRQVAAYRERGVIPDEPTCWWRSVWPTVQALGEISSPLLVETPLLHPLDLYGGTPDDVSRMADRRRSMVVRDWKTANEPKTRAQLQEHEDQLAGYCDLVAWHLDERPTAAEVVVALPTGPAQVHRVDLPAALDRWRARRDEYHATRLRAVL